MILKSTMVAVAILMSSMFAGSAAAEAPANSPGADIASPVPEVWREV